MRDLQTRAPPGGRSRLATWAFALVLGASRAAALDWQLEISPDDALYPVLDLSQGTREAPPDSPASIGDGSGLVVVDVRADRADQRVDLTIDAEYLQSPARLQAVLPRAGMHYLLKPSLVWDRDALSHLDATRTIALRVTVRVDDGEAQTLRRDVRLHALHEALYYVRDGAERVDLSWIFAAYADPRSAVVDTLIARARARHPELGFDGYGDGDARAVTAQAYALWEVLEEHGVRYADEDPGIARGPAVWSQRVRLHEDVWRERRANCLDGSLLLAAALERIGIRSVLLLVPRHALLAFYTRAPDGAPQFIETTLLGARGLPSRARPSFAQRIENADADAQQSFAAALGAGQLRYSREARRFGTRSPDYQWIDLATARRYGIVPLASPRDSTGAAKHDARQPP